MKTRIFDMVKRVEKCIHVLSYKQYRIRSLKNMIINMENGFFRTKRTLLLLFGLINQIKIVEKKSQTQHLLK